MRTSSIPTSWCELEIGDVAEIVAGGTPKAADKTNFAAPGTGVAWLTPADLSGYKNKFISHGARDLSQKGLDSSSAKLMPKGTLLFSSRAPIGYVAIAANEISTNQGFKNFLFTSGVDPSFAYYYLRSIRDLAESKGTGTTFKEISGATAKKLPFVVAPLAEQKQVAARLDVMLAQVDTIKARLDTIPAILKSFRQSVLAAAVSGRLTEEWQESSQAYYKSVEDEIKQDKKLYKISALTEDELNLAISLHGIVRWKRWKIYPLEKLVKSDRGIPYGIVQTGQHTERGVPTIRCGDVKILSIDTSSLKLVSREVSEQYTRTLLKGGEVLLAIRGTVGNAAVAPESLKNCNISREVALIPVRSNINAQYIAMLLQSPGGFRCLAEKVRGVAQKGINLADVKRFVTPLPTLDEQTEIVRRVKQLFAFVDQIEQRVEDAQARVNHLNQSILAKAFRGELTTEWREQNPDLISGENSAEALLARIKVKLGAINSLSNSRRSKKTRKVS